MNGSKTVGVLFKLLGNGSQNKTNYPENFDSVILNIASTILIFWHLALYTVMAFLIYHFIGCTACFLHQRISDFTISRIGGSLNIHENALVRFQAKRGLNREDSSVLPRFSDISILMLDIAD